MNRGPSRIERTAQRRASFPRDVRYGTFPGREFIRKRHDHNVGSGFRRDARLEEPDALGMRKTIASDEGPKVVIAVVRKVKLDANSAARPEWQSGAEPGRLRFG